MNYPTLPVMQCDAGCGKCCGPVPVRRMEFQVIEEFIAARGIEPVAQGLTCPLYLGGTCAVYEVRPMLCRVYGHLAGMNCPHGYNVNIPRQRERKLMGPYLAAAKREGERWLHELVPGGVEIVRAALGAGAIDGR